MEGLLDHLSALTGRPRVTRIVPAGMARAFGWGADLYQKLLGKQLRMSGFAVYNLLRNNAFDSSKAARELGFTTRPFEDTLRDTIEWLEAEGRVESLAA